MIYSVEIISFNNTIVSFKKYNFCFSVFAENFQQSEAAEVSVDYEILMKFSNRDGNPRVENE